MTSSNPTEVGGFQRFEFPFFQILPYLCGGNINGKTRIQSFQPITPQVGCEDSGCENWESLQVQHQLSHNMDTKIQTEGFNWKGDRSA